MKNRPNLNRDTSLIVNRLMVLQCKQMKNLSFHTYYAHIISQIDESSRGYLAVFDAACRLYNDVLQRQIK